MSQSHKGRYQRLRCGCEVRGAWYVQMCVPHQREHEQLHQRAREDHKSTGKDPVRST